MNTPQQPFSNFSNTLTCSICNNPLLGCSCQNTFTTSGTAITSTTGYAQSGTTFYFQCQACGSPLGACVCTPKYIMAPTPNYISQYNTWPIVPETISGYDVVDTENKEIFKASGDDLTVLHRDEKEGLYVKTTSLHLPILFKDCFYQLKSTGGHNLWQLRAPLTFRFNLPDKENKVPHFFALHSIIDASIFDTAKEKSNRYLSLAYPHFQEITDQLELIRLIEIQRVFVKLLGRF